MFSLRRPDEPYMDCVEEPYSVRRRPTILPGLDGLLEGLHTATQKMKVGSCDVYDATLGPASAAVKRLVDQAMVELNKYEFSRHVYGGRDIQGHTIRASEDPNRIIVIEPWYERRSDLDLDDPGRRNFFLGRGGPKAQV